MDSLIPDHSALNEHQREVYDKCINGSESIFCTGQGGTGKSFLLSCIVAKLKEDNASQRKSIAVTASTGSAAFLINGTTLHRFAGIGIEENNLDLMVGRARGRATIGNWINAKILIIDEISMISAQLFDNLSKVAQAIRKSDSPFGGIRLLMFGDFLQLPPVTRFKSRIKRVFESETWSELSPISMELSTSMRQSDPDLTEMLNKVRLGVCHDDTEKYIQSFDKDIIYDDGIEPVRLHAKKDKVAQHNAEMLERIDSPVVIHDAKDSGNASALNQCPAEKQLSLKIGAQVMLIRNLATGLVNGTIGTIQDFISHKDHGRDIPLVKILQLNGSSITRMIAPVEWTMETPNGDIIAKRMQIPLILAWSMTIHKSQGKTIPRICIDMEGIFENGQAYVALSRCVDPENIQVRNFVKECVLSDRPSVEFHCLLKARGNKIKSIVQQRQSGVSQSGSRPRVRVYRRKIAATPVASDTTQLWDHHKADTLTMLGQLSLQETQHRLDHDSETF
jgi:ATP-dependent DNA helicase PIF1